MRVGGNEREHRLHESLWFLCSYYVSYDTRLLDSLIYQNFMSKIKLIAETKLVSFVSFCFLCKCILRKLNINI